MENTVFAENRNYMKAAPTKLPEIHPVYTILIIILILCLLGTVISSDRQDC